MKTRHPELLVPGKAIVGECPKWHAGHRRLYWVDIQRGLIHSSGADGEAHTWQQVNDLVTSLNFRSAGGFLLTLRKAVATFDPATEALEILATPDEPEENRFNDAQCDRQGRLWAGTMSNERWNEPSGFLYRFDREDGLVRVREGVTCSNGTGWSPDGRTMYHTESFRYTVFAYDFDPATGGMENRRPFIQLDPEAGEFPDGLTVDAEGFVWSAHVGRGRIVRYDPDGKAEQQLQLPVTRGTSCGFGGPDCNRLFLTSARETLTPADLEKEPLAGSLFAIDLEVQGLPEAEASI